MPKILSKSVATTRDEARRLGLTSYFNGVPCKNNHVANRRVANNKCFECNRTTVRRWNRANPERAKENVDVWKLAHPEKIEMYTATRRVKTSSFEGKILHALQVDVWRKANPERHLRNMRNYAENNRERIRAYYGENSRAYHRAYHQRRKSDPHYRLPQVIRCRVRDLLRDVKDKKKFQEELGCSLDFLISYIEERFAKGMTWANHGLHTWHLDHVRSLSSFDLTDPEQRKIAMHYTNLQPLFAKDNLKKSGIKKKTIARLLEEQSQKESDLSHGSTANSFR